MSVLREVIAAPDQEIIDLLSEWLDMARRGEITDIVVVGAIKTPGHEPEYMRANNFTDRWRILGALEYAKASVENAS